MFEVWLILTEILLYQRLFGSPKSVEEELFEKIKQLNGE